RKRTWPYVWNLPLLASSRKAKCAPTTWEVTRPRSTWPKPSPITPVHKVPPVRTHSIFFLMRTPSKDARLEIWKVTFARSSFIQAKRACDALLNIGPAAPGVLVSALSTTALVFYARPFKQDPEVKLDKAVVPAEFLEFHDD